MPNHVGIIMDGNRRWAAENRKPVFFGHKEGTKNLEALTDFSIKIGIKYLTIFTFSTENWERPKLEVNYITKTFFREKRLTRIKTRMGPALQASPVNRSPHARPANHVCST